LTIISPGQDELNVNFQTWKNFKASIIWAWKLRWVDCTISGLDINVCPIPVKTDVGQVDLVLRLSDGTSEKNQIPKHAGTTDKSISTGIKYCLGLLYKRALFDLQFVHNLFWLKLKWNARSKLFYCIYRSSIWSSRTLTKLKSQSQKRFNERKYQYLKYKNKNPSGTDT
jgi:hypothetical protein